MLVRMPQWLMVGLLVAVATPALADMRIGPEDFERMRRANEPGFWGGLLASIAAALGWVHSRIFGPTESDDVRDVRARLARIQRRRRVMKAVVLLAALAVFAFMAVRMARADVPPVLDAGVPAGDVPVVLGLALATAAAGGWTLEQTRTGGWPRVARAAITAALAGVALGYYLARSSAYEAEQRARWQADSAQRNRLRMEQFRAEEERREAAARAARAPGSMR